MDFTLPLTTIDRRSDTAWWRLVSVPSFCRSWLDFFSVRNLEESTASASSLSSGRSKVLDPIA